MNWFGCGRQRTVRVSRGAARRGRPRDAGTAVPLIMLCFAVAGLFTCASIGASAAFLAQRELAGICDGAAISGAQAFARGLAPAAEPAGGGGATGGSESISGRLEQVPTGAVLPLDGVGVSRAVSEYEAMNLAGEEGGLTLTASTDGRDVAVTCRRTVRIPFGRLLGYSNGLDQTVVARAQAPLS